MKNVLFFLFLLNFPGIIVAQCASPSGDEITYGTNNQWVGYVYDNIDFTNYRGYVIEGAAENPYFNQNFGGDDVIYNTSSCSIETETFSVRYKLTKTFSNASYTFTVGGDDGYRLSLDGGATWVIEDWDIRAYTTTSYTVTLNGTYNMVLEYFENDKQNLIFFELAPACIGTEDTNIYGTNDVWNGYVYYGVAFDKFVGVVHEGQPGQPNFDQDFGGANVWYSTSNCPIRTEGFSVRYRLRKTFPNGAYRFTVGGDDGYRLSLDGGITWLIEDWEEHAYSSRTHPIVLNGTYDLVVEYYDQSNDNRVSFSLDPMCIGTENTSIYGTGNIWNGYIYAGLNFNVYQGMVHEGIFESPAFDQDFGGDDVLYQTSSCNVRTENFTVRYRLTKDFQAGSYSFTLGGDDAYRFSVDGGTTWIINQWTSSGYTSLTTPPMDLSGNTNLIIEYREVWGFNKINFSMEVLSLLPVQLEYFNASHGDHSNFLNWKVATIGNARMFEVERSFNGIDFSTIQNINGSQEYHYSVVDKSPGAGKNFYRLKMTDDRGVVNYSKVVLVNADSSPAIVQVFPTPTYTNQIALITPNDLFGAEVVLYGITGNLLEKKHIGDVSKNISTPLIFNTLERKGVYFILIKDKKGKSVVHKVIRQ